jgi:hypothetical protein
MVANDGALFSHGKISRNINFECRIFTAFVCIGFFIDNISINNLVQCAMCTPKLAMRRSEGMMLNMST